jgi:hypothetical protein
MLEIRSKDEPWLRSDEEQCEEANSLPPTAPQECKQRYLSGGRSSVTYMTLGKSLNLPVPHFSPNIELIIVPPSQRDS